MPAWGELLKELNKRSSPTKYDDLRREYLAKLYQKTGRNIILYATNWTRLSQAHPGLLSIVEEDIQGFMEVVHGLSGSKLDLIISSPGGSPEATEAIVSYLRAKFDDIRVVIPQSAMSAATMLACAGNKIVMGRHSSIGPIDPQMIVPTPFGPMFVPAQAVLDQFNMAKSECAKDPRNYGVWLPMLGQYGPALLIQCSNAIELSKELVYEWLKAYMFAGRNDAEALAAEVSKELTQGQFRSHGRHINKDRAKEMGLIIEDLEADQDFQDLVLSVFHATTHTFDGTPAVKIIENHNGRAFLKALKSPGPVYPPPPAIPTPPSAQQEKKGIIRKIFDRVLK